MKKYIDLSPLHMGKSKTINEEQIKIKIWRKWLAFSIVMSVLSITPTFYFSFEASIPMYVVAIYSLFGVFTSLTFIKMYKGFVKTWEEFEADANRSWKEMEDKQNKGWNEWFERARNSGNHTEEFIKNSEQDIINNSKKSVKEILGER